MFHMARRMTFLFDFVPFSFGYIKRPTVSDYLEVMLLLSKSCCKIRHMACFLSESALLHTEFGE